MLVPAHAFTGSESFSDALFGSPTCPQYIEDATEKDRAVLVGQRERLLFRKFVVPRGRVIDNVPTCHLIVQPFPNVSLGCPGPFSHLCGSNRPRARHRLVKPQ